MIIGECPYDDCDGDLWIKCADKCPAFQKHDCETCGRVIWTKHSRWSPESYPEELFHETFEVDEKTKVIKER